MKTIKLWISNIISKLGFNDKMLHLLCNIIIVVSVSLIFNLCIGIITSALISIGKELYDKYRKNGTGWSWDDLIVDGIGILLGTFIIL